MGMTMRRTQALIATVAAVVLGGLGWTYAATDDGPIAVANRLSHNWVDAYNKRDTATLASLYVNNAVVTPEGQPNIQKLFDQNMKRFALDNLQVTRSDITMVHAEIAIGRGTWSGEVTGHTGGEVVPVTGTYLAIGIKATDGEWKFLGVDWSLVPLPVPPEAMAAARTAGSDSSSEPNAGTSMPSK
jgi:ketosteroid isomerase-like protein